MELLPEAKTIRDLHQKDMRSAREKLFMVLNGWLSWPDDILQPSVIQDYAHDIFLS